MSDSWKWSIAEGLIFSLIIFSIVAGIVNFFNPTYELLKLDIINIQAVKLFIGLILSLILLFIFKKDRFSISFLCNIIGMGIGFVVYFFYLGIVYASFIPVS